MCCNHVQALLAGKLRTPVVQLALLNLRYGLQKNTKAPAHVWKDKLHQSMQWATCSSFIYGRSTFHKCYIDLLHWTTAVDTKKHRHNTSECNCSCKHNNIAPLTIPMHTPSLTEYTCTTVHNHWTLQTLGWNATEKALRCVPKWMIHMAHAVD